MDVTIEALASRILASEPTAGGARIVLIDGPAGAGKTTLARRLAARLDDAPVLHADDMYEGWSGLPALHLVLCDRVLVPLARGEAARFARWDWYRDERGDEITVPAAEVVVIEGVGVAQRRARDVASLVIWVEAPEDLRHGRWLEREGSDTEPHWRAWASAEASHFAAEGTRGAAHVVVDGAGPV